MESCDEFIICVYLLACLLEFVGIVFDGPLDEESNFQPFTDRFFGSWQGKKQQLTTSHSRLSAY